MTDVNKWKVLFVCRNNSCRSQMAEGLLRALAPREFEAFSAGMNATSVHPVAIRVMGELDIDISSQRSKTLSEFDGLDFDLVITVCGEDSADACPVVTGGGQRIAWSFEDPAAAGGTDSEALEVFRKVRDRILASVESLIRDCAAGQLPGSKR